MNAALLLRRANVSRKGRPNASLPRRLAPDDLGHPEAEIPAKLYTAKQMGDACEMLVAAELTLAGVPALTVPDNWPGYDVIAQPREGTAPLRISVKSRTYRKGGYYIGYQETDKFEWLAVVILGTERGLFLIPLDVADAKARRNDPTTKSADGRYWRIDEIADKFLKFEDNFCLNPLGDRQSA
jgi:hypothetical protein